MINEIKMLEDFHKKFECPIRDRPEMLSAEESQLRVNLIYEEFEEFLRAGTLESKLDAVCDLLYVVLGTVVTHGFGSVLPQAFAEVHRSNMSKLWTYEEVISVNSDKHDIKEIFPEADRSYLVKRKTDGKVIKSPSYFPANLKQFIYNESY